MFGVLIALLVLVGLGKFLRPVPAGTANGGTTAACRR